jgi:hypothetical protein
VPVQKTKRRNTIKYLENQVLHHPLSYQIFESLLDNELYSDMGELDIDIAKSLLLYISDRIIRHNRDNHYSGAPYEPVPIHSNILRIIFTSKYRKYIDYFINKKILTEGVHIAGVRSTPYGFGDNYQTGQIVYRNITNKQTVKKIRAYNFNQFQKNERLYYKYENIIYWYTTGKLSIDKEGAQAYIEKFKDRSFLNLAARHSAETKTLNLVNIKFPSQFESGLKNIKDIDNGDYNVFVDYRGWRLYSAVTLMSSALRNYLSYDRKRLTAIDLSNSQAFHLCHILTNSFWSKEKIPNSFQTLFTSHETEEEYTLLNYFLGEKQFLESIRNIIKQNHEDIDVFKTKAVDGSLYDYLSNQFKVTYPHFYYSRKLAKLRFIQLLNFDTEKQYSGQYKDYQEIKEMFPNVFKVVELLKMRKHNDISFLLQRLEAKLFIHAFTKKLGEAYPELPIFSIHDNIITYTENKEQAIEILKACYMEEIGITPSAKTEDLNHENAMNSIDKYINSKMEDSRLSLTDFNEQAFQQLLQEFSIE